MLKLLAFDEEDLAVFSFHLHQARLCPHEILWQAAEKRFLAPLRRFNWDAALSRAAQTESAACAGKTERVKAGAPPRARQEAGQAEKADFQPQEIAAVLHCDRVLAVHSRGIRRGEKQRLLTLKGLCFRPSAAAPAGILEFLFYERAGLRLELECIEMRLTDLSA